MKEKPVAQKTDSATKKEREDRKKREDALKVSEKKRSKAKAAGVCSVSVLDEKTVLVTSFGKGNDAVREKYVAGQQVTPIKDPGALSVSPKGHVLSVKGFKGNTTQVANPLTANTGKGNPERKTDAGERAKDLICLSDKLEQRYFGRTFEDNLHIQLIYSILDIEKILSVHINNIVYEIANMQRSEDADYDLIGDISLDKTYENFIKPTNEANQQKRQQAFENLLSKPQLRYFGDILSTYKQVSVKQGKPKEARLKGAELDAKKHECYDILAVLGTVRQAIAHGNGQARATLYAFDARTPKQKAEWPKGKALLDKMFVTRINGLNKSFLEMSKQNLFILFDILGASQDIKKQKDIIQKYYDFIVRKLSKNMGFSIKHLRETMLTKEEAAKIKGTQYDSVRSKLYRLLDFILFYYYVTHEKIKEELVTSMRASKDENEKEGYYTQEADRLWTAYVKPRIISPLMEKVTGDNIKAIKSQTKVSDLPQGALDGVRIGTSATGFTKMIYLLTNFLDGKEINDLLTTLINKFEGIANFLKIMQDEKMDAPFKDEYAMFEKSEQIAQELRTVNSFARMSKESPNAKPTLFVEAAQILGDDTPPEQLEDYINRLLDSQDASVGKVKIDRFGREHKDTGFRNFIANNVIESDRFKYLVRYGSPQKIRKLANNRAVINFVMRDIPETQIIRYYESYIGRKNLEYRASMREELADAITKIRFEDFKNVVQGNTRDPKLNQEKERKKAVIRLYLTVLYLLQKNIVYINSRYFLAFMRAEHDSYLADPKYEIDRNAKDDKTQFAREQFAKDFVADKEHHPMSRRVVDYLKVNFDNSNEWMIYNFRNLTEHLDVVRNMGDDLADIKEVDSYFGLYHYLVQCALMRIYKQDKDDPTKIKQHTPDGETVKMTTKEACEKGKMLTYFRCVEQHKTYCKDFVKAYCVAFAYNLPRYKNLSIQQLFDRNNFLPRDAKEAEKEEHPVPET